MEKYAVDRVVGNDTETLFVSESKDEAWQKAEEIFKTQPRKGTIRLISAEYDDDGNRVGNRHKQYKAWF